MIAIIFTIFFSVLGTDVSDSGQVKNDTTKIIIEDDFGG